MSWITTTHHHNSVSHDSDNLRAILTVGITQYGNHTEWFLKHRETVLRQLAVLIAAELAIWRLVVKPEESNLPAHVLLPVLAFMSLVLAYVGWRHCQQAFTAAMENVVLVNKIIWSMAPSGKVHIPGTVSKKDVPTKEDETLYVPRFLKHSTNAASTDRFVDESLSLWMGLKRSVGWVLLKKHERRANTYFWTTVLIWSFGAIGAAVGVLCFAF